MNVANIEVLGQSRSGNETCIMLPGYGVALDMGICPPEARRFSTVLITHGHPDHTAACVRHAALRVINGIRPAARYIVPPHLADDLEAAFAAYERMQGGEIRHEIVPLAVGEELDLGDRLSVRPFPTDHSIPSQGYALVRRRDKLKAEHRGLPGAEIARLRRQGVEVTDQVEVVEVAYPGDTRASVLDDVPLLTQARLLIMEATFVGEELTQKFAAGRGHTHILDHADRAERYENDAVLFVHFSMRHSDADVHAALAALPEPLRAKAHALI